MQTVSNVPSTVIWLQIVVAVVSIVVSCGFIASLLIFILRGIYERIEGKADAVQCGLRHEQIEKDLNRGEIEFRALRQAQGKTNELLAAIKQQIDDHRAGIDARVSPLKVETKG